MSKKKRVYIFGNPSVEIDSLPVAILPMLKESFGDVVFEMKDPVEVLEMREKTLWIIDTVVGLNKVVLINDILNFTPPKAVSVHDYDLVFDLTILKKLGKLANIYIIGIPPMTKETDAFIQVKKILTANGF